MPSRPPLATPVPTSRSSGRGGGFTLVELLVVIAIIAVLMGVLLPALAGARQTARSTVSVMNMRSLGMVIITYAAEQKDAFVNPFGGAPGTGTTTLAWHYLTVPNNNATLNSWNYGRAEYAGRVTEPFAYHWTSFMLAYLTAGQLQGRIQFSPADIEIQKRSPAHKGEIDLNGAWMYEGSYWLSPTTWLSSKRYEQGTHMPINTTDGAMWRRNRMGEVPFPQAKVMLFERMDFSRRNYLLANGQRVNGNPTWNDPEAAARFVLVDGSVDSVKMSKLHALNASANQAERNAFTPSGPWNVTDTTLHVCNLEVDGLENGGANGTKAHPAFFWATRKGIQGRDINR